LNKTSKKGIATGLVAALLTTNTITTTGVASAMEGVDVKVKESVIDSVWLLPSSILIDAKINTKCT